MEGVFDVVHLYIRKILCYDTPNLSTQYPSCSSLFISSFVYYTIDFQVTCVYYREGNLKKGGRVNNLFSPSTYYMSNRKNKSELSFNSTSSNDFNKLYNKNTENTITYECNNNDFSLI